MGRPDTSPSVITCGADRKVQLSPKHYSIFSRDLS